jgi:hypothetical protein
MFHVELRQFPHVARAFNLTEAELNERFLGDWVADRTIDYEDQKWSPEKARLTIYEGPRLPPEEMGVGRGWGNVTRTSKDVTEAVVARARHGSGSEPAVEAFKDELVQRVAGQPMSLEQVLSLAAVQNPGRRVSEQLALAEQSVWELLYQGRIAIVREDEVVPEDEWQMLLLTLSTWTRRAPTIAIRPPGP